LTAALTAGFSPDRLIALRPPIGAELETALWRQWGITTVITKASGQAGGEQVKQRVAQILGIPLIIIDRPPVEYPLVSHSLEELLALVETWWKFQN
jgi:precorrin-6A/cobalt-precorrin-6A reductase